MPRPLRNYTPRQLTNACENKLAIAFGSGKHRSGWYLLNGRKLFKITIPKAHAEWGPQAKKDFLGKTRLSSEEFDDLIRCSMTGPAFASRAAELFTEEEE